MRKVLIFGGARTGTTTLSHCIRNSMLLNYNRDPVKGVGTEDSPKELEDSLLIDEPLNNPLRKPRLDERDGYVITRCFEKAGILHKLVLDKKGGVAAVRKLTAGQIYKLLDEFYSQFYGIKHLHDVVSQQNNKVILDYASDHDIKILYVSRRNAFDIAISKAMSKQEGIWHTFNEESVEKINSFEYAPISIKWLKAEYKRLQGAYTNYTEYLNFKDIEYQEVCYEDFLGPSIATEDRLDHFKDILEYIEWEYVDSRIITNALHPKIKQHSNRQYEKVPNIEEIYRWRDSQ